MGRLILIAVAVAVVVWLLRRALAEPKDHSARPPEGGSKPGELVRCAYCGLHLPRAEAHAAGGRHFCSDDHAARGPRSDA